MTSQKLIVVIGCTGKQGGSVVETFLNEPAWRVRGTTRNPSSAKAKALDARGVEIVEADLDAPASLALAFQDAHAIFAFSDFWTLYNDPGNRSKVKEGQSFNEWTADRETQQLKNVIDVAANVPTLERLVISSLPNVTKLSGGKYTQVYHFDSKANAVEYGREAHPDLWAKTSVLMMGYFLSNLIALPMGRPVKKEDGTVQFASHRDNDVKFPLASAEEDTGPLVLALVNDPATRNVTGYREWLTMREIVGMFAKVTGYETKSIQLPWDQFGFDCPPELQDEIRESFAFGNEFGLEGRDDPTLVHPSALSSPPKLGSVEDWLKKQDWKKVLDS